MGHCGKFGYVLWATAADLAMHYGLLQGMRPYSKNLTVSALGAIEQDLVIHNGPLHRILLSAMGRCEGFG
jgi:hypothetical protein